MKVVDFSVSTPQHVVLGTRVARCVALLQQFGAHNQNDSIKGERSEGGTMATKKAAKKATKKAAPKKKKK